MGEQLAHEHQNNVGGQSYVVVGDDMPKHRLTKTSSSHIEFVGLPPQWADEWLLEAKCRMGDQGSNQND